MQFIRLRYLASHTYVHTLSLLLRHKHTHTHTHTHSLTPFSSTHPYTHAHAHAHTLSPTHSPTLHTHPHFLIHKPKQTHTHTPALFAYAPFELLCDGGPFLGTVLTHQLHYLRIVLCHSGDYKGGDDDGFDSQSHDNDDDDVRVIKI
jgi:hypothetical protein